LDFWWDSSGFPFFLPFLNPGLGLGARGWRHFGPFGPLGPWTRTRVTSVTGGTWVTPGHFFQPQGGEKGPQERPATKNHFFLGKLGLLQARGYQVVLNSGSFTQGPGLFPGLDLGLTNFLLNQSFQELGFNPGFGKKKGPGWIPSKAGG